MKDRAKEELSWERCLDLATAAITDLSIHVYRDIERTEVVKLLTKLEDAVEYLMATKSGCLRISGSWQAGSRYGELELDYVKLLSPTATDVFILRYLKESVRLQIAKELMLLNNP